MVKKIIKEPLYMAASGICALFCWGLAVNASGVSAEITSAVKRCLNIIIPSLFAFMAVCDYFIKSGFYRYAALPFRPVYKYILKMPEEIFFVFFISNIAGYPVGVKLLSDMVRRGKITRKTAEISCCFCCCGGPAFYSGTIGLGLFGSAEIGLAVFLSIVCTNFFMALVLCRIFRLTAEKSDENKTAVCACITDSILNAGKGLFTICTMIVFFAAAMSVLDYFGLFSALCNFSGIDKNLIKSFLEITSVTSIENPSYKILPVAAALCSFGGVCVIMQIAAVNNFAFSLKYFLLTRPVNSIITALIFTYISKYFVGDCIAASVQCEKYLVNINNFAASICLILMILLLKRRKRVEIF